MLLPRRRPAVLWTLTALTLVVLVIASLAIGAVPLSPIAVVKALADRGDDISITIVRELRLPRIAMAMLVGCALVSLGHAARMAAAVASSRSR